MPGHRWLGLAAVPLLAGALAGLPRTALPDAGEPVVATAATIRDFMIQNVCVDAAGAVLPRRSPLDGDRRCPGQRDLEPGETLPYHKHDHPSPEHAKNMPLGYQRHDSVPVATAGLGIVVEHSFDFGPGGGNRFGVFDPGSDGGDIVVLSPGAASIGATQGGGGPFGLWVGECNGGLTPAALTHSWVVAEFTASGGAPLHGEAVARLNGVLARDAASCPQRFNSAYTSWRVMPFRYRAAPGQGEPVMLSTLVSDHYGGADPATADHVERFYFTRELGGTRWERWQNVKGNRQFSAAAIAERAAWFGATGRCSAPEPPAGAAMLLIDCREWTRIVPPIDPAGDRAGFFVEAIRARPDAPRFFAAPAEHR
jgi:hypothetical protein